MKNLDFSRVDNLIERNCYPGHCKELVRALAGGSPKKMTSTAFKAGSDTKPLINLGLITRDPDTKIISLTKKAWNLIKTR